MIQEFSIQHWKPEMIQEQNINLRCADTWHYKNTETNTYVPFFIEKSYFASNVDEGYRVWDEQKQTKKVIGFFEEFEDAKQFILNAYEILSGMQQ